MENKIEIQSLLQKVAITVDKYESIERITGEKYNIFSILGVDSSELAHSTFLANLLNTNGSHGQGDLYLRLFVDYLKEKFIELNEEDTTENSSSNIHVVDSFETVNSVCYTEQHAGKVNFENEEGGRIDILLSSSGKEIIIENKIYAGDQYKQLKRYYTYNPKAPIFYLSLFKNKKASKGSEQGLIEGEHYFALSYEEDIRDWLDSCIEKSSSIPFLRETLRQYSNLIKRLTNQLTDKKMKSEIKKMLTNSRENYGTAKAIFETYKTIKPDYCKEMIMFLKNELKRKDYNCSIEKASRSKHNDGLFIFLTDYMSFSGSKKEYAIGINVEIRSNHMFYCIIEKGKKRNTSINSSSIFDDSASELSKRNINLKQNKKFSRSAWNLDRVYNFSKNLSDPMNYLLLNEEGQQAFKDEALDDIMKMIHGSGLIKKDS